MNIETMKSRLQDLLAADEQAMIKVHASAEWREHLVLQGRIAELQSILQDANKDTQDTE